MALFSWKDLVQTKKLVESTFYWNDIFFRSFKPQSNGKIKSTILVLHGGPGMTHDYLLPVAELANYGYHVIFYDQSGAGKSDKIPKFTVNYYVNELKEILDSFDSTKIHLLGHSWGATLALAYVRTYPNDNRIGSLILCGGLISVPLWCGIIKYQLLPRLPPLYRSILQDEKRNPDKYKLVSDYYYNKYLHIIKNFDCVLDSYSGMNNEIFERMWGYDEFTPLPSSELYKCDLTNVLENISYPLLNICGEYDEPAKNNQPLTFINGKSNEIKIVQAAAHMIFTDNFSDSIKLVVDFLDQKIEKQTY